MRNRSSAVPPRIVIAILFLLPIPTPAYAYIDPASGSMILQLILGGGASAWLLVRRLLFGRKKK